MYAPSPPLCKRSFWTSPNRAAFADVGRILGPRAFWIGPKKVYFFSMAPCCYKPIFLNGRIIHITELKYAENVTLLTSLFLMLWVIFIARDKMKLMSCHFVPPIWSEEQKQKKTQWRAKWHFQLICPQITKLQPLYTELACIKFLSPDILWNSIASISNISP